jgi:hypothetical protein
MRSSPANGSPVGARRAWDAPAITELPIGIETKAAEATEMEPDGGRTTPPPPASPATKLGFSFELSFPLSVRTE